MAIARGSTAAIAAGTVAFNNVAGTVMIISFHHNDDDGTITGITYNGVALTLAKSQQVDGLNQQVQTWYLDNPATGTNNIVSSGTAPFDEAFVVTYTGAQYGADTPVGASATGATEVNVNISLATSLNWVHAQVRNSVAPATNNGGVTGTDIQGSGTTWDSNGTVSSGSQLVSFIRVASAANWGVAAISIAPAGAAPGVTVATNNNLSLLGVGS